MKSDRISLGGIQGGWTPPPLLFCLFLGVFLSACESVHHRQDLALQIAASGSLKKKIYKGQGFHIYTQEKIPSEPHRKIHVYIEGDGYAWAREHRISPDPTPLDPIGLRLAAQDPFAQILYLARPCQYTRAETPTLCSSQVWTSHSQSRKSVQALSEVLDQAKARYGFQEIIVFGYSGGAGIAAILAAERKDVKKLVTIAGNLDHEAFTRFHGVTPLTGSLKPRTYLEALRSMDQVHFVGEEDTIIPPILAQEFLKTLKPCDSCRLRVIPGQNHFKAWDSKWGSLLAKISS